MSQGRLASARTRYVRMVFEHSTAEHFAILEGRPFSDWQYKAGLPAIPVKVQIGRENVHVSAQSALGWRPVALFWLDRFSGRSDAKFLTWWRS